MENNDKNNDNDDDNDDWKNLIINTNIVTFGIIIVFLLGAVLNKVRKNIIRRYFKKWGIM